jgi:hypothetical protein
MAEDRERTPHERETLIFPSSDEAKGWLERVGERLSREDRRSVRRRRELLGEELARQFERHGEGVGLIPRPWEHTQEEHVEVQKLVDLAFERDLPAALKVARGSDFYPRNVDLLHDVLTTEMYELLQEHKLNRQPISWGILLSVTILVLAMAGVALIWWQS